MNIKKSLFYFSLLALVTYGCSEEEGFTAESGRYCLEENFKKKIKTDVAELQDVTEGIHMIGSVEANPDKVVQFVSLMGGIISKTSFSLGDKVEQGQVLAELRSTELSGLEAELKNLEAQRRVAKKKLQSVESMYEDGISSEQDLMEAESELSIIKSDLWKVKSNMELYSASSEKNVFQIKAPTTGIVTSKAISAGTQISADSDPLFTISDLTEVWVMIDIYATNVRNVKEGMPVNLTSISYPDTVFKGTITAISQVLDKDAKVLKARVLFENQTLKLKPGMLVDVIALKDIKEQAIAVPTESMVFDNNQNYVVVYKSDCDLQIRKVEVLSKNNGLTFLRSGLEQGENIISKNQLLIYEQLKTY